MEILVTSSLAIGAAQTPGSGETESMGSPREGQKPDRKEGLPGSVLNLGIGQKKKITSIFSHPTVASRKLHPESVTGSSLRRRQSTRT